jgi:hypothetical protein
MITRLWVLLGVLMLAAAGLAPVAAAPAGQRALPAIWLAPDPSAIEPMLGDPGSWESTRGQVSAWCVPHWWLFDATPTREWYVRKTLVPTLQEWGIKLCVDVGPGAEWYAGLDDGTRGRGGRTRERTRLDRLGQLVADGVAVDYVRIVAPLSRLSDDGGISPDRAATEIAELFAAVRQAAPGVRVGIADATFGATGDRWTILIELRDLRARIRAAANADPDFVHFILGTEGPGASMREAVLGQEWLRANGIASGVVIGDLAGVGRAGAGGNGWHDRALDELARPYWHIGFETQALVIGAPGIATPPIPESDPNSLTHLVAAIVELFQTDPLPTAALRDAPPMGFPNINGRNADSNSPSHWDGGTFYLFNSVNRPWRSQGPHLGDLSGTMQVSLPTAPGVADRWLEATYKHPGGALYGWYHVEPYGICPPETNRPDVPLTAPRIGALRSFNNGANWEDLGTVIEAPGSIRCNTANRYYAGGTGDFSVLYDEATGHFYFFFSSFAQDFSQQGIGVARMAFNDRDDPVGRVRKYYQGDWTEPGIGGRATMVFPALVDWHRREANGYWGPSIHWNIHLSSWVMLLNRAHNADWWQEGIYLSYSRDLSDPLSWSAPRRLHAGGEWYPQVIGTDAGRRETDKLAGQTARYFEKGHSQNEIVFEPPTR